MSVADRILAMCSGDVEQADLVLDTLARRVTAPDFCPTCLHELDEAAYCACCGHLDIDRPSAPDLSEPRAEGQKEQR